MKVVVHMLVGGKDTYKGPDDCVDVYVKDGVLSIVVNRYQGEELKRYEYPLTSVHHWEYSR